MNISGYISRRLRLRGASGSGSAAGAVIAVTGVALALMIMEFTLAIVVGFKNEIRDKLVGFDAQITIGNAFDPYSGLQEPYLTLTPELASCVREALPDSRVQLSLRQPGILKTDSDFEGIMFVAQQPAGSGDFTFERSNIVEGFWPDFSTDSLKNAIVISRATAKALGLNPGDKVYSHFIVGEDVKMRRNTVAGIYESDFGTYDRTIAYCGLPALQKVAGLDSMDGNRIDIRGISHDSIASAAAYLQDILLREASTGTLDRYYPVNNILDTGTVYFSWLDLLDTNVAVIFALMLCVAGFTLVSSLFILILSRVQTIGILRSMGATKKLVRHIFINMAMRLVGLGMITGNVAAIGLLLIQEHTHIIPLDPEMYYLKWVPVEIVAWQFVLLNVGVALACWLIMVLPSHLASRISPVEAIKYE